MKGSGVRRAATLSILEVARIFDRDLKESGERGLPGGRSGRQGASIFDAG
jgi:hypothetical protein